MVVPTYNRVESLDACLSALAAQDQPRDAFEVIVVDDGSRKPPRELVARFESAMQIRLIEGPFKTLEGAWRFTDLAGAGCKVELSLRYEFSSLLLEKLVGPVFGFIANSMVDAFVKRAQKVYG